MLVDFRSKAFIIIAAATLFSVAALLILFPFGVAPEATRIDVPTILTAVPNTYRPEKTSFAVTLKGLDVPYRVIGLFVMPGETVDVTAVFPITGRTADLSVPAGTVGNPVPDQWQWTAPRQVGWYPLTVTDAQSGEAIRINAFVMVPYDPATQSVEGFRVGRYQARLRNNNPIFARPKGFIKVTDETRDVLVSPHFTIGQFTSKQTATYPKYLVLNEKLLLKLELLLQKANEAGIHTNSFHVMSGYRTPHYNALIGNDTEYSLHLYGAAADIFVDRDENGYMDDLNGDGDVTTEDARVLAAIVEKTADDPAFQALRGGLGVYSPAPPRRGPFIHVDVRGQVVRW
ncbi:MAG TPA: hypothetical protein VFG50_00630 [Rhodothermales bacterium]|nr:hypothetical protein [Rhodothermales bacterium]